MTGLHLRCRLQSTGPRLSSRPSHPQPVFPRGPEREGSARGHLGVGGRAGTEGGLLWPWPRFSGFKGRSEFCIVPLSPLASSILPSHQLEPSFHGHEWGAGSPPGSPHSTLGLSVTPSHGNPSVPSLGGMALGQGAPCIWPNSSLPSGHPAEAQGTWSSCGEQRLTVCP